jgi:hypothetical protein
MLKSIQLELVEAPTEDLLALLKESKKLLQKGGTVEIISPTKLLTLSYVKPGKPGQSATDDEALSNSTLGKMLREAGFVGSVTISRRGHLSGERTHVIAAV